ncbi:MAG: hypothetical protein KDC85_13015 [Saprospiraceae bacterium]|nr:hypothetical protein [Saprospiraceae bacterium]
MDKYLLWIVASVFIGISCSPGKPSVILEMTTDDFKIAVNDKGALTELTDLKTGTDYLSKDTVTCLMSVRINNEIKTPQYAKAKDGLITLYFEGDLETLLKPEAKASHLTFELLSVTPNDAVDLVIWGPYFTTINKIIGETVGVVRGETYAVGIQSLNIKTLGGYPWNESDRMPGFDIFEQPDPNNLFPENAPQVLYRVEAAKPTDSGSSLQAYCRNRNHDRIVSDFDHERLVAPAYDDGGVIGSKIVLFGCPVDKALETLGVIELAEGLPHPQIDGQWGKTAPGASAAYLITAFTEGNVDEAIALTQKAGLRYLYHYGKTFENWGHFDLYQGEFPNGIPGFKKCVEKAEAQGIMMGTHVLSNFITTNDPYVTPVPDQRLAKVGSSVITEAVDATQTEIPIQSADFFNQYKNNNLKTVMIGTELIRYQKVSENPPWRLLDCQRGAFETVAANHPSGEAISKLLDHGYKVFLTNADLTVELSETLAELYNQTGLRQISFDGLEGNRSTGLGAYGESLMPYVWYNNLSDSLKNHLIIDASRTTHFFWHIYTRMNWGEPWYGGFRESQTEYRMKNQKYFKRNFMPGMLGWFKMTPETTVEDIEWLLARSAGYDAGYAFVADQEAIAKNGRSDQILSLIGDWEKLRMGGAFTEAQKTLMQEVNNEFTLEKINDREWLWHPVSSGKFRHEQKVRQPGEPLHSTFEFENIGRTQPMQFILTAEDAEVREVSMEIDDYKVISLPFVLKNGQILQYAGGDKAHVYNKNGQRLREIDIKESDFEIGEGTHTLTFDCRFDRAGKAAAVKVEVRTLGAGERVVLGE